MIFAQHMFRDKRRCTIFTRNRHRITKKVFQTRCHFGRMANTVGHTLITTNHVFTHHSNHVGVFAEGFELATKTRVGSQVEHRRKIPWNSGGSCFIGCYHRHVISMNWIESSCDSNLVRKHDCAISIGGTMDGINTINNRNFHSGFGGGNFLYATDNAIPFSRFHRVIVGGVENGTNVIFSECPIQAGRIKIERDRRFEN